MSPAPPRYVLDTNVCLDVFVFGDAQCASLLAAVHAGEIELVTRDDCRAEWQAVLGYPQLKLSDQQRAQAMRAFDACVRCLHGAELAARSDAVLPRCSDRDDQKFLELALESRASALLTRDDALLRLARRTQREGLFAILRPGSWQEVESGPG